MRVSIDERLARLCADFSVAKIGEWLERKFASYDTSRQDVISIVENKNDKEYFKSARLLGYVRELPDGRTDAANRPLLVAVVEMRKILTERTSRQAQFNFAKRVLQNAVRSGAAGLNGYPSQGLFFFYDQDKFFRISLVSGEMEGRKFKFNEAKRQSFYINPDRPNNVAKSRLSESIATFAALKEAFSVETLTKEFYGKLFDWYEWAMKPRTGVTFPNDDSTPDDDRKYNNESIIRLITRLMFTWFIRQRDMVRKELFTVEGVKSLLKSFDPKSMADDNYYRCILQNLFFATFNCQPEKRRFIQHSYHGRCDGFGVKTLYRYEKEFKNSAAFKELVKKTPFLNCALFDCLDKQQREIDGGKFLLFDGFSDSRKRQAHVPNGLFFHPEKGLISLFDTYEFTIDENNADDADVALDPELLGKVFENLLGAYNPETKDTARNATGSFYTPREIVDYMVEESLKNHIKTKVPQMKDAWLAELFDKTAAVEKRELPFDDEVAAEIREALYSCKILDPACGSGAFPMGILHCMVRLFGRLDPANIDLNKRLIMRYKQETNLPSDPLETAAEREERLKALKVQLDEGQHYPDYARKLYLIENCIYGVDIQPIATQISKLRFFISLLCDQLRENWSADRENQGLLSLPNLEAKFVCANTLISLPKTEGELELMSCSKIPKLREKLQENRHRIFAARTFKQKEKLKARDLEIRDEIRDAVRSTLAKPDKELIKVQEAVIAKLRKDRIPFESPKMIRQKRAVQADFFAPTQDDLGFEMVDANKPKRDQIDAQIDFAQRKIDSELAKGSAENVTAIDRLASLVAGWDPYDQNASSSFFDPEWMFNISDGFDVVIGNPPYISHDQIPQTTPCERFDCYESFADIYCYFYERGVKLLSANGIVCYITSNSFLRVNYGLPLRRFVQKSCDIVAMIDIERSQIFESAIVNTVVTVLTKVRNDADAVIVATAWNEGDFDGFVKKNSYRYRQTDFLLQPWTLARPDFLRIREKMERAGKTLEQRKTKIRLGLATGDNNAFVVDEEVRSRLIKQDSNNRKLIKPVIRGQDIQRYCHGAPQYILLTKNGVNVRRDFPTVYKYLDGFGEKFKKRGAKGAHWTNLRACAFLDDFKFEKIIWIELTDVGRFSYSNKEEYLLNSAYFLLPPKGFAGKFMLGLLNSSVIRFFMKQVAATSGMGTLRWINNYVKLFPIPDVDNKMQTSIADIADQILAFKAKEREADTSALEAQIDQLVYRLYGLTEEEIAIVEGRDKTAAENVATAAKPSRRRAFQLTSAAVLPQDDDEELE